MPDTWRSPTCCTGHRLPVCVSCFSGSPVLYRVLAAAVDAVFGLGGARALSLLFMLGATALLYALTRLLLNERAALCAAAIFAVCPSTIFMGNFATYDSAAILLLALASWIVIRTRHLGALVTCLLAAPVLALVVAVKYASLLFVPTVAALAVLAAFRGRRGWSALSRGMLIPVLTGAYLAAALLLTGTDAWQGVPDYDDGTGGRHRRRPGPAGDLCAVGRAPACGRQLSAQSFTSGGTGWARCRDLRDTVSRRRWWRILLALLLCGSAVLAPAHHMQLHTAVSLHKHIGYGLLFAAPLAGVGLSRVVGAHFRHPQFGILIWVAVLMTGITLSRELYLSWPDPQRLVAALQPELAPGKRYLVENSWPPQYYLRGQTEPWQWTSTYAISYSAADGRALSGRDGYLAALDAGHFDVIVLDGSRTPGLDEELIAKLPVGPSLPIAGRGAGTSPGPARGTIGSG